MEINVETTKKKYFRQVLELLKPVPPFNILRAQQLDILAQFLYYNHKYRHIEKVIRFKILFDYETKVKIREEVGISESVFNNILTSLRKANVLTSRGLVTDFGINPDKEENGIHFKFIIKDEEVV